MSISCEENKSSGDVSSISSLDRLMEYIKKNNFIEVLALMEKSNAEVVVNTKLRSGTPLSLACKLGFINIAQTLISDGKAQINLRDYKGLSPVHWICIDAKLEPPKALQILRMLSLNSSTDFNLPTHDGQTPLMLACAHGKLEIVRELVEIYNVDTDIQDKKGFTALMFLTRTTKSFSELGSWIFKTLSLNGDYDASSEEKFPENYYEIAELLLCHGADVNSKTFKSESTVLHFACHQQKSKTQIDLIKLLLRHGAQVNAKNAHGKNAFHYACLNTSIQSDRIELVDILIGANVDVDLRSNKGKTGLFYAMNYQCFLPLGSRLELADHLINSGHVDLEVRDNRGMTPFLQCCCNPGMEGDIRFYGYDPLLISLLNNKVDATKTDNDDRNALHLILANPIRGVSLRVFELIVSKFPKLCSLKNSDGETPVMLAASRKETEMLEILLSHGEYDLMALSKKGFNTFMYSCTSKSLRSITLLLYNCKSFDVDQQSVFGDTALTIALQKGIFSHALYILENLNVSVNVKNALGQSPLSLAVYCYSKLEEQMVLILLLLEKGAKLFEDSDNDPLISEFLQRNISQPLKDLFKFCSKLYYKDGIKPNISVRQYMWLHYPLIMKERLPKQLLTTLRRNILEHGMIPQAGMKRKHFQR